MSCQRPPEGFHCRLPEGHDGPCPAWEDNSVEYGIRMVRSRDIHREGMTWRDAEAWMAEWTEDGGRADVWEIVVRLTTPWQKVHLEPEAGLRRVRDAIRRARGGDAPPMVTGYA